MNDERSRWGRLLAPLNPLPSFVGVRNSVRDKLMRVVLTTTVIALCVAGISLLTADLQRYQNSWRSDLATEASILAVSVGPALAFNDHEAAVRDLNALSIRPRVVAAALYTQDGAIYASFVRAGVAPVPSQPPSDGVTVVGERVEISQRIERNGELLGTLYLRSSYDVASRVAAYLGIFALATILSLAVAFLLSRRLQRRILEPLDAMAAVAKVIVHQRDYSLRAPKTSDDEIGVVVNAFNNMLEEVEVRSRALQESNQALSEEIEVRKSTQAALSLANTRLESTMAAAEIGTWLWDIQKNEFTADRNLATLYGLEDEHALSGSPENHYRHIHPEDLESVKQSEQNALTSGVLASIEFRVRLANGAEKWMARRGKVQLDDNGKAIFISGLLIDITAQKQAEKALRASEKLYRAIGESINFGVWVCDREGRNVYTSESYLRLVGMTQAQVSSLGWSAALDPADAPGVLDAWNACVGSGNAWYRELRVRGIDDRYHWVLSQGMPIRGEDGLISGWAGISLDIARLKLTEEALREADRRKDEFLATMAHELRNPLAPIRHATKVLESAVGDEDQHQWARDVIARQVRRMALLLDDLLDVSRITQGRLELKIAAVTLGSLIDAAVETARPLIDSKQHLLTLELPARPVTLKVDGLRISQSLANLLTNSAKYTDNGGQITLSVTVLADHIRFSVKDTGIGIDIDTLPDIFEMFSQAKPALNRSEGGLGIGLALVKGLVGLHQGTVEARSEGLGQGSEFIILLPASLIVSGTTGDPSGEAVAAQNEFQHRILVADDNRDAADSLAMLLEIQGHRVSVAYTGTEALRVAAQTLPHAAILDIGMPDMNGYEVARQIRAQPWGCTVYTIALTGWGQKEDKARALAAGFDQHLTKPVDPDELTALLQRFLQSPRPPEESGPG